MTAMPLLKLAVLAAGNPLMGIRDYLNRPRNPWLGLLFWAVALAVLTVVLVAVARRSRRRQETGPGPWGLFFRVVRTMGLSWPQRWLLWRIARYASPRCPAAILFSPSALSHAARAWARGRAQRPDELLARRLGSVSRTLFAGLQNHHA